MARSSNVFFVSLVSVLVLIASTCSAIELPTWAYPVNPSDFKPAVDDGTIRRVPDSEVGLTLTQARNFFLAPDWHPQDHPKMPEVVARGRAPAVLACGFCHRADGPGGPENASIASLPYAYIVQQMNDYKNGSRSTALPTRLPQKLMISLSKTVTEAEIMEAAAYFSALKPRPNIRVVETASVWQIMVENWILAENKNGPREPIGQRIIELPESPEHFESRDSRAKFVAYVPVGSVKKGEALVLGKLPDKAPACATCHGADLRGMDATPSIAGRSPTYIVRQLYELHTGIRNGQNAAPMRAAIDKLDLDDMISIAAYLAARTP